MSIEWTPNLPPAQPEVVERAKELVSHCTTDVFLIINLEALASYGWVAVPILMDQYSDEEAQRLATAIQKHLKTDQVMAIGETFTYTSDAPAKSVWTVPPTMSDLKNVAWELSSFYFLVTDQEPNFLVWCTKDDWHVVAGPLAFVSDVVGKPLDAARQQFVDFWNEEHRRERSPYFLEWAERLSKM